jgi:hypothetical protein
MFGSTSGSEKLSKCSTTALNTSLSNPGYFGKEVLVSPLSNGPESINQSFNKSLLSSKLLFSQLL